MAKNTIRDRIWDAALTLTFKKNERVKPEEVAELVGNTSERTVSHCLVTMSEKGWLEREALPDGQIRYKASNDYKFNVRE